MGFGVLGGPLETTNFKPPSTGVELKFEHVSSVSISCKASESFTLIGGPDATLSLRRFRIGSDDLRPAYLDAPEVAAGV